MNAEVPLFFQLPS